MNTQNNFTDPENPPEYLTREGVTKEDYVQWLSLTPEQKQNIRKNYQEDNSARIMEFRIKEGLTLEEAFFKVLHVHLMLEDYPLSENILAELKANGKTPEDFHLPWQLMPRINRGMNKIENDKELTDLVLNFTQRGFSFTKIIRTLIARQII